jgi:hypothetical protein
MQRKLGLIIVSFLLLLDMGKNPGRLFEESYYFPGTDSSVSCFWFISELPYKRCYRSLEWRKATQGPQTLFHQENVIASYDAAISIVIMSCAHAHSKVRSTIKEGGWQLQASYYYSDPATSLTTGYTNDAQGNIAILTLLTPPQQWGDCMDVHLTHLISEANIGLSSEGDCGQ